MNYTSWDFLSFDNINLKVHEAGQGRLIILLHGLFSNAHTNWIKFGQAEALVAAGYHVVMPDFRAHGQSASPQQPEAYPRDVLVRDILALIEHLAADEYDLVGFSLGARTTAKLLAAGSSPRRAILIGMGLEGLAGWEQRQTFFLDAIGMKETAKRGDRHWLAIQFMKSQKIDTIAASHLLRTFSDMTPEEIALIETPTMVLCGSEDADNGDPKALAQQLPFGLYQDIPGTHMSSVTKKEMAQEMVKFLS